MSAASTSAAVADPPGQVAARLLPVASVAAYRQALAIRATRASFVRIWRGFLAARSALATALVLAHAGYWVFGKDGSGALLVLASGYWVVAALTWGMLAGALDRPRATSTFVSLWSVTVGVDVVLFSAIYLLSQGVVNYLPLFVLPTLMASVLGTRLFSLFVASALTCLLLTDASLALLQDGMVTTGLAQAAVLASALFVVALLANELATRLERQEALALVSQAVARRQVEVSRMVIEQMDSGVLVVDDQGVVQSVNPAARRLLADEALHPPFLLAGRPSTVVLANLLKQVAQHDLTAPIIGPAAAHESQLDVPLAGGQVNRIKISWRQVGVADAARTTGASAAGPSGLRVLFLEDVRESETRLQQEKLAAMGRLTAGVAHEIRNPLAAIAHASQILAEDLRDPSQQRLLGMVRDNTLRLDRLVDDILEVARTRAASTQVALAAVLRQTVHEWVVAHPLEAQRLRGLAEVQATRLMHPLDDTAVWFDADHLRRVLVNLLDNALLHGQTGPIDLGVTLDGEFAELRVLSQGPELSREVQARLFEPFFSTRSRGSGLGLHLCAELCERHGATLRYERANGSEGMGNAFVVRMRLARHGEEGRG
jgi:two-component system sensor histidine kinase PilS (NtrC family)